MMRVIGLMSGTSLDGVDAVLIETDGEAIGAFGPGVEQAYSTSERAVLERAVKAGVAWGFEGPEPDFSDAETVLTRASAAAVAHIIREAGLTAKDIDLIGFHGQTVLHRAPAKGRPGATRQIGAAAALARETGIDVVFDFRSADIAAGGHGAPLAPLYHDALARRDGLDRPLVCLNLGGVANITWLPEDGPPVAFDTGPASGLLDAWCAKTSGRDFDRDGELAAKGQVSLEALDHLLDHPYFDRPAPKSLDRWDFSLDPVESLSPEDGAATLTAFTARTVTDAIKALGATPGRILVSGGGRKNPTMMAVIASLSPCPVEPVEAAGWRGDLIEAEAFAWLAARSVRGLPLSLPTTTGVSEPLTGGRRARA